jgi:hypothetical protein
MSELSFMERLLDVVAVLTDQPDYRKARSYWK